MVNAAPRGNDDDDAEPSQDKLTSKGKIQRLRILPLLLSLCLIL